MPSAKRFDTLELGIAGSEDEIIPTPTKLGGMSPKKPAPTIWRPAITGFLVKLSSVA